MKLLGIVSYTAFISLVCAEIYEVQLFANSKDIGASESALYTFLDNSHSNYIKLGNKPDTFHYDSEAHKLYNEYSYKSYVGIGNEYNLVSNLTNAAYASIQDEKLYIDGTSKFFLESNNVLVKGSPETPSFSIKAVKLSNSEHPTVPSIDSVFLGYTNLTNSTLTFTEKRTIVTTITTDKYPTIISTIVPVTVTTTYLPKTINSPYAPYRTETRNSKNNTQTIEISTQKYNSGSTASNTSPYSKSSITPLTSVTTITKITSSAPTSIGINTYGNNAAKAGSGIGAGLCAIIALLI